MVHVESDLLQLKPAWETSLVSKGPWFSVVFALCLLTNKGQLHSSPFISLLGRKECGNAHCAARCFQAVCILYTLSVCWQTVVSLESLGCLWENLKELLEQKLAGLATAGSGKPAWQQGSYWLLIGILEASRALAMSYNIILSTAFLSSGGGENCIPGKSFNPNQCK